MALFRIRIYYEILVLLILYQFNYNLHSISTIFLKSNKQLLVQMYSVHLFMQCAIEKYISKPAETQYFFKISTQGTLILSLNRFNALSIKD